MQDAIPFRCIVGNTLVCTNNHCIVHQSPLKWRVSSSRCTKCHSAAATRPTNKARVYKHNLKAGSHCNQRRDRLHNHWFSSLLTRHQVHTVTGSRSRVQRQTGAVQSWLCDCCGLCRDWSSPTAVISLCQQQNWNTIRPASDSTAVCSSLTSANNTYLVNTVQLLSLSKAQSVVWHVNYIKSQLVSSLIIRHLQGFYPPRKVLFVLNDHFYFSLV